MKSLLKLIGVLVLVGILASSCSKLGSVYDGTTWYGKTETNTSLTLSFTDNAQLCVFSKNPGHDILSAEFHVEWTSKDSFKLLFVEGEQPFYSGMISSDILTLDELRSEDKQTYELIRVHF